MDFSGVFIYDVRDIGGWRNMDGFMIKQGIFYRSAELGYFNYPVSQKSLTQLMKLGIVCEIDLRSSSENPQILMPWLRRYVRPVNESGLGISPYLGCLTATADRVYMVFKEMAEAVNYPMILHCRSGSDRTGTIVALLEALLGCSELQIGQDYIWSSLSINGIRDTASFNWHDFISYIKAFDKKNATIQEGVWNYLQSIGITVRELLSIRKIFLNNDRQPFPELGIRSNDNDKTTVRHKAIRVSTLNITERLFIIKKGIRRITIFDCSGKKIWHYTRSGGDTEIKAMIPLPKQGIYIVQSGF
jgi:protein tyrosine phosphatase (PTP) superfamily phosphohydrolase (DUF442 family)